MKPCHLSSCVRGKLFAGRTEVGRSDECHIGWAQIGLYRLKDEPVRLDARVRLFRGELSLEIPYEKQGNKENRDRNEGSLGDDVEQMQHERHDRSDDAGDGIPLECEELSELHLIRPGGSCLDHDEKHLEGGGGLHCVWLAGRELQELAGAQTVGRAGN